VKCESAEEVEAKAALMGARALTGLGHIKLILEMDCSSVAAALRTVGQDRSPLWHTYDQTKKILSESFEFLITLVEKSLLVAHHFGICVAHMGCASTAMPLITVYWWRMSICATHMLNIGGAYRICAISVLCVAHIAICTTNT
jgi:hypothetical protein